MYLWVSHIRKELTVVGRLWSEEVVQVRGKKQGKKRNKIHCWKAQHLELSKKRAEQKSGNMNTFKRL